MVHYDTAWLKIVAGDYSNFTARELAEILLKERAERDAALLQVEGLKKLLQREEENVNTLSRQQYDTNRQNSELRSLLNHAVGMLKDWGGYAPDWAKEKHDFQGDLNTLLDGVALMPPGVTEKRIDGPLTSSTPSMSVWHVEEGMKCEHDWDTSKLGVRLKCLKCNVSAEDIS